jgi:hypothetical protein
MRHEGSALFGKPVLIAEDRDCGGSPEADDDSRFYERYLGFEPGLAGVNFGGSRFLVQPALASLFEV